MPCTQHTTRTYYHVDTLKTPCDWCDRGQLVNKSFVFFFKDEISLLGSSCYPLATTTTRRFRRKRALKPGHRRRFRLFSSSPRVSARAKTKTVRPWQLSWLFPRFSSLSSTAFLSPFSAPKCFRPGLVSPAPSWLGPRKALLVGQPVLLHEIYWKCGEMC